VLLAGSFALMPTVDPAQPLWLLVAWAILGRIGLGFVLPSLNLGAMRPLDKALIPQGASAINFLRMLGGAAGVSLCAIVLEWRSRRTAIRWRTRDQPGAAGRLQRIVPAAGGDLRAGHPRGLATARRPTAVRLAQ
jgi:hypothetical protein